MVFLALQAAGVPWEYAAPAIITLIPLALSGWMVGRYTPKAETARVEQELTKKIDNLTALLEKHIEKSERVEETRQSRYATIEHMNGLGRRIDELKETLTDTAGEARAAFNLAQNAAGSAAHLAQRLEEVIGRAITRLEGEIEKLSAAIRKGPG